MAPRIVQSLGRLRSSATRATARVKDAFLRLAESNEKIDAADDSGVREIRTGKRILFGFFGVFGVWAAFAPLDPASWRPAW
jgi:hypothetical protein